MYIKRRVFLYPIWNLFENFVHPKHWPFFYAKNCCSSKEAVLSVVTSRCLAEKKGPLYMQRERPRAHFLGPPTYIQRGCIRLKDVFGGELKGRPLCKGRQGLLRRGARTLPCAQHTLQPSAQKRGRQRVCFAVVFVCGLQWLLLLYGKKTARECVSREGSFLVGICMQSTIEGIVKVCGVTSVEILLFVAKNKFNQ